MSSAAEVVIPESRTRLSESSVAVELTHDPLDVLAVMNEVKSPEAGAVVLFAGKSHVDNLVRDSTRLCTNFGH
jgi:molybdopterin synthase catalytic subunit